MKNSFTLRLNIILSLLLLSATSLFALPNGAPYVEDDVDDGTEDTVRNGNVAINDSDPDDDVLTYSVIVQPSHGTITMNSNGTYTYTPEPEYVGFDYVTYQACDPGGLCGTAIIEFGMSFVNDFPIANDDVFYVQMNTGRTASVATNDIEYDNEPNFWSIISPPSNAASFSMNLNGTFSFTPVNGYTGTVTFTYQACDPCGVCDQGTVTLIVANNSAPNAQNDSHFTQLNVPLSLSVAQNDSDPNGDALTYSVVTGPANGTFSMNSNGVYSYTPNSMWWGFDYITYQACDVFGVCDQATLEIEVVFVNILPVAVGESYTVAEDGVLTGNVGLNDYDPNIEPIIWPLASGPIHGGFSWNAYTGAFTYYPDADWYGTETIVYTVCDDCGACNPAALSITVTPVNDAPVLEPESETLTEDGSKSGNLSINDYEPEEQLMTYSVVTNAAHGTFTLSASGSYSYTPTANYFGNDQVTYRVCDPSNACSETTISFVVTSVNDLPVCQDDNYTVNEDQVLNVNPASNDSDIETATLTYEIINNADYGTAVMTSLGALTYTPNANYNGSDMIIYHGIDASGAADVATIVITVLPVNDAPVVNGESITVIEDVLYSGNVATNDSDVETATLNYTLVTGPAHGTLLLNTNGTFTYTPASNYFGSDQFIYKGTDAGSLFGQATVLINVTSVNDVPVVNNETVSGNEDTVLSGNVSSNDSDVETAQLNYTFGSPSSGTFVGNTNGSFTYTPIANYNGTQTVTYTACDASAACTSGTLTLVVNALNDLPVAGNDVYTINEDQPLVGNLNSNDSDVEGQVLSYTLLTPALQGTLNLSSNGSFNYQPSPNYNGSESLSVQVCDTQMGCVTSTLNITINAVNDAPVVSNDNYSVNEEGTLNVSVATNDTDVETTQLTYTIVTQVSVGSVSLSTNGQLTYTPPANYFGTQTFTYSACDNGSLCGMATVTIQVLNVNDAPVVASETFGMLMNTMYSSSVATNDSDADGEVLSYTFSYTGEGLFVGSTNGSFNFTPNENQLGQVTVSYTACDAASACASGLLTINIALVNGSPLIVNDEEYMYQDFSLASTVSANDSDPDEHVITYTLVSDVSHGVLLFNSDGSFTYEPNALYIGSDSFEVMGCDIFGACANSVTTIEIQFLNDAPEAQGELMYLVEDVAETLDLSTNDTDADMEPLFYSIINQPLHGTAILTLEGMLTYLPFENYFGSDELTYSVCDALNECVIATVVIDVQFVNDLPVANDDAYSTTMNNEVTGNVGTNDIELDPEVLTFQVLTPAAHGNFDLLLSGNFTYTPNDSYVGNDTIYYRACDPCGACDIGMIVMEVLSSNTAPVLSLGVAEECSLTAFEFDLKTLVSDTEQGALQMTYSLLESSADWNINSTNGILTYIGSATGVFDIAYTVCDNGIPSLCSDGILEVTIVPAVSPELIAINATDVSCNGAATGSISIEAMASEGEVTYQWSNESQASSISELAAGEYTVLIGTTSQCSSTIEQTITIEEPSPIVITGLSPMNISEVMGGSSDYTVEGGTAPYDFAWYDQNDILLSTQMQLTGVEVAGNYYLHVTDDNGCVVVEELVITGLEEAEFTSGLYLYPNPVRTDLTILVDGLQDSKATCEVYDQTGRMVHQQTFAAFMGSRVQIDTNSWGAGLYQVVVRGQERQLIATFVKQ